MTAFSVDDVLAAHDFLREYQGNIDGLFPAVEGSPTTEWRADGRCALHGNVWNVVRTQFGLPPDEPVHVRCPACLLFGVDRRSAATSIVRLSSAMSDAA